MRNRRVLIVDSEDGYGGGSVYLKRYKKWLTEKGIDCSYISIERGLSGYLKSLCIILRSWFKDDIEVRGTIPIDIAVLAAARRSVGYVQSPADYWSDKSRLIFKLACMAGMTEVRCVSETTFASIDKLYRINNCKIEYAKIEASSDTGALCKRPGKDIVFVVLDQGNPDKGYYRHLAIVREATKISKTRVEIYGKEYGEAYKAITETHVNGFVEAPFCEARNRYPECRLIYLGCSRYEGLHMAVVDSAGTRIPSILSDIPAHRELERICDSSLLISQERKTDITLIKRIVEDESVYMEQRRKCRMLADRFHELSERVLVAR